MMTREQWGTIARELFNMDHELKAMFDSIPPEAGNMSIAGSIYSVHVLIADVIERIAELKEAEE